MWPTPLRQRRSPTALQRENLPAKYTWDHFLEIPEGRRELNGTPALKSYCDWDQRSITDLLLEAIARAVQ
jgi:hypothetical protein